MATPTPHNAAPVAQPIVTDLNICILSSPAAPSVQEPSSKRWHRLEKDLYLHSSQQSAHLYLELANAEELAAEDLVVLDIRVGTAPPDYDPVQSWENRPGGLWVRRGSFSGDIDRAVTDVDVLFGLDAVDPRPQWDLMRSSLQLDTHSNVPVARLSILRGRAKARPEARAALRVDADGKLKIVQVSDTHMVTGVGVCKDALDADGKNLPERDADQLTAHFIGNVLDVEKPGLVILTGDQLHHDIHDSQTALFKALAPIIERSIPFAAVFGNHDSEGRYALSRTAQMSILQNLPLSLCEPGPDDVDGVGNFCIQVLAPAPSHLPLSTLFFLDSHGQVPGIIQDYEPIKQSQIDWFTNISRAQQSIRENNNSSNNFHLSLAFLHIPLPEFGDRHIKIYKGQRREPTEGPSVNSHFYDALVQEGVSALGCGHDHVNDFCALTRHKKQQHVDGVLQSGPWLCYGGGSGFGGYCSYGRKRFHRRMRVWVLDTTTGGLKTWMRVEYREDRVDELVLVQDGAVLVPTEEENASRSCVLDDSVLDERVVSYKKSNNSLLSAQKPPG